MTEKLNIKKLEDDYFNIKPDINNSSQKVSFGTSGHRGSSLNGAFNEMHIQAITQAAADYRKSFGIDGPLFIGVDSHAISNPAII